MDKTLKREELATLLRSLSAADMAWLRQRLLRVLPLLLRKRRILLPEP